MKIIICRVCGITGQQAAKNRRLCLQCRRKQLNASARIWRAKNTELVRATKHAWRIRNPEKHLAQVRNWRIKNPDKWQLAQSRSYARKKTSGWAWRKKRLATDPAYAIKHRLQSRLLQALKSQHANKAGRTQELIGCSYSDLRNHLERQFQPGMSWQNRSEWHIDHIRPCASFDLTKPEQQKACFNYRNLQPLWEKENLKKSAEYTAETQLTV